MLDTNATETASMPSPEIHLQSLDDEVIKTLIADGYKLLDRRKREREQAIKEQIKELAASEGIKVFFREPPARRKRTANTIKSN